MGTPVAVAFANLFLQHLEYIVFSKLKHTHPLLYKRYIDDIFAIFKTMNDAITFIDAFNKIVPSIRTTHTTSTTEGIFLDLVIYKGKSFINNKLDVRLYQKPQNKYLYLPFNSYHNRAIFDAFVNSELNRIRLNCSEDIDYENNKQLFYHRLCARDYPIEFLKPLFAQQRNRIDQLNIIKTKNNNNKKANKQAPIIFKTNSNQESKQLCIKACLKLPQEIHLDPDTDRIFNGHEPLICYKKSKNFSQLFSKSKFEEDSHE